VGGVGSLYPIFFQSRGESGESSTGEMTRHRRTPSLLLVVSVLVLAHATQALYFVLDKVSNCVALSVAHMFGIAMAARARQSNMHVLHCYACTFCREKRDSFGTHTRY
jgi:uncharacterized membrane protein YoaK (UPF0700 family)